MAYALESELFLQVDGGTAMYQQIIDQITAKIAAGDWPAGHALPSIRELAASSRISVITVKRAYLELERSGVIVTRAGKGSFVADAADQAKALLQREFDQHFDAMLLAAAKIGLNTDTLKQLIAERGSSLDLSKEKS